MPVHLPLNGIRILDLSWNIAGPATSAILADLGAEVWKVERPGIGDDARRMAPLLAGEGAYFWAINRNKRSLAIDIGSQAGRDVLLRLAKHCDVFLENFRHGKAEALGLGPGHLAAIRPDLIYCSLSAYGDRGPERAKAGYDAVLQARTGIMSVTGAESGPSVRCGVSILDLGSAVWAALGIVSGILARRDTGRGRTISTSLFETGVFWMLYHLMYYQATHEDPQPQGSSHSAFAPYGAYHAADGDVVLGVSSDRLFQRCCRALGVDVLAQDPRYRSNLARVANRASLDDELNRVLRELPLVDCLDRLDAEGVPAAPLQRVSELIRDPQLAATAMLASIPEARRPAPLLPRLPLRFDGEVPPITVLPPRVGEHTVEVLRGAGFTPAEIDGLLASEAIADGAVPDASGR